MAIPADNPNSEWAKVKKALRNRLSPEGYDNWLDDTRQLSRSGASLLIGVPDAETRSWLITEYAEQIDDELAKVGLVARYEVFGDTQKVQVA